MKCKKIGEVLVINDGSYDNTENISKKFGSIIINNNKNKGYDKSIQKGLKFAFKRGYKYAITIDADGQHLIKDALKIYTKNENKYYIVKIQNNIHDTY